MNASRQSALLRVLATTIAIVLVASCGGTPEPQVRVEQQTVVVPQQIKETVVVEQQVVVTPTQAPRAALVEDIAARPDGTPAPPDKQVLRWDYPGDFFPDPIGQSNWLDQDLMFAGLTALNLDGTVRPDIAEKWEASADGKTWTFHLRKDAKFSDGSPITVDDVLFSFNALLDPKGSTDPLYRSPFRIIAGYKDFADGKTSALAGLKASDASTVQFTLDVPTPHFPAILAPYGGKIASKKNVTEGGEKWWLKPVSSGPWKAATFEFGERDYMELVPNENYVTGPQPKLSRLIINRTTDASTMMTRYENGEIDVAYYPPPADVAAALKGSPLKADLVGNVAPGQFFFYFRHDRPPFDDPKVRQAFNMALDMDKLSRVVLQGTLTPMKSLIPRGTACWQEASNWPAFDPEKARALLAESKYGADIPSVRILVSEVLGAPSIGRWTRVASAMAEMWQENLGLPISLQNTEFEFEATKDGAAQIFRSSASPLFLDPAAMTAWFGQGAATAEQFKYSNPEVQKLLADADVATDQSARCGLYQQADKLLIGDGIYAAAWGLNNWAFAKPYVRGISMKTSWQFHLSVPEIYIAE
ncbi:MAG: peptide ABC transporter substrate-binding protein [Kouleothrix sp.]|jgi:ABC-type transport system substrate-binding protein|nr:peptide ABC transporter substrate-binding protein [Kouleothrix sp.]